MRTNYRKPPMSPRQALTIAAAVVEREAAQPRPDLPACTTWQREASEAARLLQRMAKDAPPPVYKPPLSAD